MSPPGRGGGTARNRAKLARVGHEVRRAEDDDLGALVAALGQAPFFADSLRRQAEGAGQLLVAVVEGAVVGDVFVSYRPPGEAAIRRHLPAVPALNHLEVHPRFRRRGIGTALIVAGEQEAARAGATRVFLGVEPDNVEGRRLYERLGFVEWPHGTVPTGWMVERDGCRMYHRATVHVLVKALAVRLV